MAQFRPQFTLYKNENNRHMFSLSEYSKGPKIEKILTYTEYEYHTNKVFVFPTYAELKKLMKKIMRVYWVTEVSVSRSRRGEWGEWFENWSLHGEVLTIDKEGWM